MDQGETLWGRLPMRHSTRDPYDFEWIYIDAVAAVVADEATVRALLGEAHLPDERSGPGSPFDAWLLACPCGLEVIVKHRHDERDLWWVCPADDPDVDHVLHHLALPGIALYRRDLHPEVFVPWRVEPWLLRRYDDNGQHFDVHRFASRHAAECSLRTFEARGHRQTYVVEPEL